MVIIPLVLLAIVEGFCIAKVLECQKSLRAIREFRPMIDTESIEFSEGAIWMLTKLTF